MSIYAIIHLVKFLYKCHNYVSEMHAELQLYCTRDLLRPPARSMIIITNYDSYFL